MPLELHSIAVGAWKKIPLGENLGLAEVEEVKHARGAGGDQLDALAQTRQSDKNYNDKI